jgi:hypothetical protein
MACLLGVMACSGAAANRPDAQPDRGVDALVHALAPFAAARALPDRGFIEPLLAPRSFEGLAWSGSGAVLALIDRRIPCHECGFATRLLLVDADTGRENALPLLLGSGVLPHTLVLAPSGRSAATVSDRDGWRILELVDLQQRRTRPISAERTLHGEPQLALTDGALFYSASGRGPLEVWDLGTDAERGRIEAREVQALGIDGSGTRIGFVDGGFLRVYDVDDGRELFRRAAPGAYATAFSGDCVAVALDGGAVQVFELAAGNPLGRSPPPVASHDGLVGLGADRRPVWLEELDGVAFPASWSSARGELAFAGPSGRLAFWRRATGAVRTPSDPPHALAVGGRLERGELLLAAAWPGHPLDVWDMARGRIDMAPAPDDVSALAFGDELLAIAESNGRILLWEPRAGLVTPHLTSAEPTALAFDATATHLYVGDDRGEIRVLATRSGEETRRFPSAGSRIDALEVAGDTVHAVHGAAHSIWNARNGQLLERDVEGLVSLVDPSFEPRPRLEAVCLLSGDARQRAHDLGPCAIVRAGLVEDGAESVVASFGAPAPGAAYLVSADGRADVLGGGSASWLRCARDERSMPIGACADLLVDGLLDDLLKAE